MALNSIQKAAFMATIKSKLGTNVDNNEQQLLNALGATNNTVVLASILKNYKDSGSGSTTQRNNVYNSGMTFLTNNNSGGGLTGIVNTAAGAVASAAGAAASAAPTVISAASNATNPVFIGNAIANGVNTTLQNVGVLDKPMTNIGDAVAQQLGTGGLVVGSTIPKSNPSNEGNGWIDWSNVQLGTLKSQVNTIISARNGNVIDPEEQVLQREVNNATSKRHIYDALVKYGNSVKGKTYGDGSDPRMLVAQASTVIGMPIAILPAPQTNNPGSKLVTESDMATILTYATGGKLTGSALASYAESYWARAQADGNMTYDEAATLIGSDPQVKYFAAGGTGSPENTNPGTAAGSDVGGFFGSVGQPAGVVLTSGPQVNKIYTLIKGDGAPGGSDLRSNGNAVFLVSSSGELFHVTEQLANEMKANNTWYEPSVRPQEDIKNMTLRMSLNHTAELGVLDFAPSGDYLLVKGDGPALSVSQLSGNGDAVYAIDKNGNKFHVTGEVAAQMQANNTWTTPAVLNQGTIDQAPITGALASASGGTAPLSIPVGDSNIVTVAAGAASNIIGTSNFKLVKGDGPNLGTSQLTGNGAAVYAVMPDGSKLHVTAQMAEELRKNNLWTTPEERPQEEIDRTPAIGTLSTISGGVGAFVVPVTAAGSSTTPNPNNPTPAVTAPSVAPSNNSSQSFTFIRGDGPNLGTSQLKGNGAAVYAVMPDGSMLHVTEKMYHELVAANKWSEPKVIPQWEMDSKTPSGTLSTINGGVGSFIVPLNAVPSNPIVGHLDIEGDYEDGLQSTDVMPQTPEQENWSQPQNAFKLIRGDGPNLGSSQLSGNGAAVYAVMPDGSKLHVTGEMAQQLQWENKWTEPEVRPQWEVDQTPATGTLATTSGGWAPLVVPVWAPQEVAPAAAPLAPAAAPVAVAPAPVPQAAPATPINPDYHPAVYSSLNQEGSLQKQLELNMFFGAANPDIFEPLKSDLNPTGSIQKQKELNTYFASVQTNPTSGGIGGSDPNAGLMPAAVPPTQTW